MPSQIKARLVEREGGDGQVQTFQKSKDKAFNRSYNKHADEKGEIDFSLMKEGVTAIKDGMVYERKCTDILFLGLFIAYFVVFLGLAGYALGAGDFAKFYSPYNSLGEQCGVDMVVGSRHTYDLREYKYMIFKNMDWNAQKLEDIYRTGVCVKSCPKTLEEQTAEWWTANCVGPLCVKGSNPKAYASQTLLGLRYCFPKTAKGSDDYQKLQAALKNFMDTAGGRAISDIAGTWKTCILLIVTGLILSVLFMYLMSRCARCLALTALALLLLLFIGGGGMCIFFGLSAIGQDKQALLITGIMLLLFGMCLVCCVWCKKDELETAIAIIDATADFFVATKRLVLVSVMSFILSVFFIIIWMIAMLCIVSLVDVDHPEIYGDQFPKIQPLQTKHKVLIAILFFGFFWILNFLSHQTKFITMVSASSFYFSSSIEGDGSARVCTAISFAWVKNAGSIAYGSLILTIIGILRMIVDTLANQAKEDGDGIAKLVACLAQCLMRCLEGCVETLTNNAYAYMSVSGDSFCKSGWNGFMINLKYLFEFIHALNIASMFIFMGVLSICAANSGLGFIIAKGLGEGGDHLIFALIPFALISLIVALVFLGQFDEAVQATLMCYAIDRDLNGEAKFGSKSFQEKLQAIHEGYEQYTDDFKANQVQEGGDKIEA